MMNEKKEMLHEELEKVVGGVGTEGFKYSFRRGDFVYLNEHKTEHFVITEDVDTDDGTKDIRGHRSNGTITVILNDDYKRASHIMHSYERFGGNLVAMR